MLSATDCQNSDSELALPCSIDVDTTVMIAVQSSVPPHTPQLSSVAFTQHCPDGAITVEQHAPLTSMPTPTPPHTPQASTGTPTPQHDPLLPMATPSPQHRPVTTSIPPAPDGQHAPDTSTTPPTQPPPATFCSSTVSQCAPPQPGAHPHVPAALTSLLRTHSSCVSPLAADGRQSVAVTQAQVPASQLCTSTGRSPMHCPGGAVVPLPIRHVTTRHCCPAPQLSGDR